MANIIPLKDNTGAQFYPQTHEKAVVDSNGVNLQTKLASIVTPTYVTAWDGDSTPVVANIPAGVSVTYNTTTYTGTLAASASTANKTYLVSTGTTDNYNRYVTQLNGSTYSWQNLGSTEIDLSDYATKEELNRLDQEINGYTWTEGKYLKSTGAEDTDPAWGITDYIPYTQGNDVTWKWGNAEAVAGGRTINFYKADKTYISNGYWSASGSTGQKTISAAGIAADAPAAAFIRASFKLNEGASVVIGTRTAWEQNDGLVSGVNKLESSVHDLEEEVKTLPIYSEEQVNLLASSPYFVSALDGAYMPNGTITSNQYTTGYRIVLFRLPAGTYIISSSASASVSVVAGTIAEESDLIVGGHLSQILLTANDAQQSNEITLAVETLVVMLSSVNPEYYNRYCQIAEKIITTTNEKVYALNEDVENLNDVVYGEVLTNLDESSPYFGGTIVGAYIDNSGVITENSYTAGYKIWLFNVPAGTYKVAASHAWNGGTVIGTLASDEDFVVGGQADILIASPTKPTAFNVTFNRATHIVLVGQKLIPPTINFYGSVSSVAIEPKDSVLEEKVDNLFLVDLDIVIPDVVYAIVGTELNIWNDTVALSIDKGLYSPLNYIIRWSCNKGIITDRCFRFTPVSGDVGNVSCSCYLYDMRGVLVGSKTFTIKVLAKNALASAKNIVYFGDSLGQGAVTALNDNFHDTGRYSGTIPNLLGTMGTTFHYEAVGGYRWEHYATEGAPGYRISVSGVTSLSLGAVYTDGTHNFIVYEVNITSGTGNCLLGKHYSSPGALPLPSGTLTKVSGGGDDTLPYTDAFEESVNPLWNDTTQKLDINQYKQTLVNLGQLSSVSDKIDAVSFQFGINDNELAYNLSTLRGYITDLYNLFVGDNANCKFIIGLTTSSGNDVNGSGANYGATFDWKAYLWNTYTIRKFYISILEDFPNLRIATPNLSLDRYYGYPFGTRQVSDRCSEMEEYHNNYFHPNTSGYQQMADAYLACYVGVLTES